ncbi:TPM domain-containing protein [Mycobacterium xenopi]|uniref:TPM domain-containing protein n=1 Tax=Mycobacterium xenopi TaxID=1789 RepID=UPI0022EAB560|nr:TPM domain-containing protein [Mycobacterium xenopi]MDA3662268.1 TPM domain-containing protein [Mycobacterium xenopi]
MRIARLFAVILVTLAGALLLGPAAAAQPPFRLSDYVTDDAGALTGADRSAVEAAVDKLYSDRHIRLWVVYVDTFSGQAAVSWAQSTRRASDLGDYDALLAVATADRAYAFLVPPTVKNLDSSRIDDLRRTQIEPALHRGDWSGAAVAAATGLDQTSGWSPWAPLVIALGVIAVAMLALVVVMRYRRRRRRAAALAAARRADPTDPDALAALPLDVLDDLSRSMVVEVDNAVRTSANELALAVDEFGQERTEPFTRAVNNAKAALTQAFNVRQQLDDAIPETPAQRRELLTNVIVSAAQADRELESQRQAFEQLRDLVINAPARLDGLTRQVVELTARIGPAEQRLAELHGEFDAAALTSVSGNVDAAKERLAFGEQNISRARQLAAQAVSGQQSALVDAVRAAESALAQARSLLDAIDNASHDIRRAAEQLPSVIADIQTGIAQANAYLQKADGAHTAELATVRDAAVKAVDAARTSGTTDPLGAFTQLTKADADLDRLLAVVAEERASAERLNRALEQALFTAQARVRAVSDYIDTRRGSIGPQARTRLAEANRQLQAAHDKRCTDVNEAIAHANAAATLADQAQSLANADVESAQQAYAGRYSGGSDLGAMMGGIIIGDLLGGAMRGGFGGFGGGWGGWGGGWDGGWTPTSFGGSSGPSDDGFMGGGGRF